MIYLSKNYSPWEEKMIQFIKNNRRKICLLFYSIILLLIISIGVWRFFRRNDTYVNILIEVLCFILIAATLIFTCVTLIKIIKQGLHNIRKCDIDSFDEIDRLKKYWNHTNQNYKRQIEYINFSYSEGKVHNLIENGDLFKLYSRLDFLKKGAMLFDDLTNNYQALVISLLTSIFVSVLTPESVLFKSNSITNIIIILIIVFLFIITFFAIVLFKHKQRGEMGSLKYNINKYEMDLLQKEILKIESGLRIKKGDKKFLFTQQSVLDYLIRKRRKSKRMSKKKEIEQDIEQIENLNLYLKDYSKVIIKRFVFSNELSKEANQFFYLAYNKQEILINDDFEKLYNIIKKYNLKG